MPLSKEKIETALEAVQQNGLGPNAIVYVRGETLAELRPDWAADLKGLEDELIEVKNGGWALVDEDWCP